MTKELLVKMAEDVADNYGLSKSVFCGLVQTESGWNTWAARYESAFYRRYIEKMDKDQAKRFGPISLDTEKEFRATSFGMCQVMGQVARELGCKVTFLTELCDPAIGLEYGAKRLAQAFKRRNGDVIEALLDYNGGGDKEYADRVLTNAKTFKTDRETL